MTARTYSSPEAAALICGTDSTAKVKWLESRLRSGRLPGFKAGRHWRMTEADVEAAIESLRPKVHVPEVPVRGLTRTSARRLAS